jgi:hypothetical protein
MTPQEWQEVEERLKRLYGRVHLQVDQYHLTITLERVSQFRLALVIYIDGIFRFEWITSDCEERRRFFRPVKRFFNTPKQRANLKKMPQWLQKESKLFDPNAQLTVYYPDWTSFTALKRHLIKNNTSIELVKEGTG